MREHHDTLQLPLGSVIIVISSLFLCHVSGFQEATPQYSIVDDSEDWTPYDNESNHPIFSLLYDIPPMEDLDITIKRGLGESGGGGGEQPIETASTQGTLSSPAVEQAPETSTESIAQSDSGASLAFEKSTLETRSESEAAPEPQPQVSAESGDPPVQLDRRFDENEANPNISRVPETPLTSEFQQVESRSTPEPQQTPVSPPIPEPQTHTGDPPAVEPNSTLEAKQDHNTPSLPEESSVESSKYSETDLRITPPPTSESSTEPQLASETPLGVESPSTTENHSPERATTAETPSPTYERFPDKKAGRLAIRESSSSSPNSAEIDGEVKPAIEPTPGVEIRSDEFSSARNTNSIYEDEEDEYESKIFPDVTPRMALFSGVTIVSIIGGMIYQFLLKDDSTPVAQPVTIANNATVKPPVSAPQSSREREIAMLEKRIKLLERKMQLAPLETSIREMQTHSIDSRLAEARLYLKQMKIYQSLRGKNRTLSDKVKMDRYERLLQIRNLKDIDKIPGILRYIDYQKKVEARQSNISEMQAEVEFLNEQMELFREIVSNFRDTYATRKSEIKEAKIKGEALNECYKAMELN